MMRFHWPISNLTFFWSAENEYNQFSSVIFAHAIIQENWKIELAEPCTDRKHSVAAVFSDEQCMKFRPEMWNEFP